MKRITIASLIVLGLASQWALAALTTEDREGAAGTCSIAENCLNCCKNVMNKVDINRSRDPLSERLSELKLPAKIDVPTVIHEEPPPGG